jgi:Zn-dependent protease
MALMASIGPFMHLALAIGFLMLDPLLGFSLGSQSFAAVGAKINGIIALSTAIPVGGLDGQKIIRWSITIWLATVILAGAVLLMAYGII